MQIQDRRAVILDSARYCFLNFGYKATTMDLIAKTAKMGKGTFYNFFKTKEDVLKSVIDDEIQGLVCLAEETKRITPVDEQALLFYMKKSLAYIQKGDLFCKLSTEASTIGTPEVLEALKEIEVIAFQKLKELVVLFANEKRLESCDIELTTFLLLELYTSLVYRWKDKHDALTEQRIEEVFLKLYPIV